MTLFYDKESNSIGFYDHVRLISDPDYREINKTYIGGYLVSTVWVGMGNSIFETMVFEDGNWADLDRRVYSNLNDAKLGHVAMVYVWATKLGYGKSGI